MFDGIKVQDVSVDVDALLKNDRLTFGGLVDTQTGFILSPIRRAQDRGLNFRLVPYQTGTGYRVEVKGSLHKFCNNGIHNADQYTANDLLLTLNRLVTDYGFNLSESKINNIEFGVNIELPFAISQVFTNLICYKNQPFAFDSCSQAPYYACNRQRYTIKIYDKGKQKGLGTDLLRFEIRVRKMQYFKGTGVQIRTLADLLNIENYRPLGALLVSTFNNILFDDPTINLKTLPVKERAVYQQCRNPRHWYTPNNLIPKQAATHRQRLSRHKDRFRVLLNQYGNGWQEDVSTLIEQTWTQLTAVDDNLLTRFNDRKQVWQNSSKPDILDEVTETENSDKTVINQGETCHKLTDLPNANMSRINPLYSEVLCDEGKPGESTLGESTAGGVVCPVTGVTIDRPRPQQRFVSASMLRTQDDLLQTLERQHRQYAKGSREDPYGRAAHNVRNRESNQRNNLRRDINKIYNTPTLFDVTNTLRLTPEQQAALDYWKGTPYEVRL